MTTISQISASRQRNGTQGEDTAPIEIGLNAAIVAVSNHEPQILAVRGPKDSADTLPFGPFSPVRHRTLEIGLREWVLEQTGLTIGYTEQLYTFGDRGRHAQAGDTGPHVVSIGYLALIRAEEDQMIADSHWRGWYRYFPWEDWRQGKPEILNRDLEMRLAEWAARPVPKGAPLRPLSRKERLRLLFGFDGASWDEEKVLERYELLYEAGLVSEAKRDGRSAAALWDKLLPLGQPMQFDHRRILATAMGRLRAKIKYRPVVFELMPEAFTLLDLQKTVEGISGSHLHKQNFRRLVENAGLVEPTGEMSTETGGRPAKYFRFRREVVLERPAPGVWAKARG